MRVIHGWVICYSEHTPHIGYACAGKVAKKGKMGSMTADRKRRRKKNLFSKQALVRAVCDEILSEDPVQSSTLTILAQRRDAPEVVAALSGVLTGSNEAPQRLFTAFNKRDSGEVDSKVGEFAVEVLLEGAEMALRVSRFDHVVCRRLQRLFGWEANHELALDGWSKQDGRKILLAPRGSFQTTTTLMWATFFVSWSRTQILLDLALKRKNLVVKEAPSPAEDVLGGLALAFQLGLFIHSELLMLLLRNVFKSILPKKRWEKVSSWTGPVRDSVVAVIRAGIKIRELEDPEMLRWLHRFMPSDTDVQKRIAYRFGVRGKIPTSRYITSPTASVVFSIDGMQIEERHVRPLIAVWLAGYSQGAPRRMGVAQCLRKLSTRTRTCSELLELAMVLWLDGQQGAPQRLPNWTGADLTGRVIDVITGRINCP